MFKRTVYNSLAKKEKRRESKADNNVALLRGLQKLPANIAFQMQNDVMGNDDEHGNKMLPSDEIIQAVFQ